MKVNCKYCKVEFDKYPNQVKKTKNNFCCKSHAAKYNNKKYPKRMRAPSRYKSCLHCKKEFTSTHLARRKYCSIKCQRNKTYIEYIKRWLIGEETGNTGINKTLSVSAYVHQWIRKTRGENCEKCGWNTVRPVTGKTPLQINHINGHPYMTEPNNIELLCPNCHALTDTWGIQNKGNGRILAQI